MDKASLRIDKSLTEDQIEELIRHSSNDPEVVKNTSDSRRFKDREAYDKWLQSNPSVYVLTNESNKLLGIVWVQKMGNSLVGNEFDTTFAIRLYGEARGKGLSSWFIDEAFKKYGEANYWLRTSSDNVTAIKTYERLGFKTVSSPDAENKIIMTRHSSGN